MQSQQPISTIVVSRPGVMRQSLLTLLAAFPWIAIVGSSGDALNALNLVALRQPTLVVIDANLLDDEVETLLAAIKAGQSPPGCLVLRYSGLLQKQILAAGADEIIRRDSSTQELEDTLFKVAHMQRI